MNNIFISYRRSDSADITGRIWDQLTNEFGADRLFRDVDKIPLGQDFRKVISDAIERCEVLLVVIGDEWLSDMDESGRRRIDNPEDYVHMEVRLALERGLAVIPVLVKNAKMPAATDLPPALSALSTINGTKVRADPDFPTDIKRLCANLPVSVNRVKRGRAISIGAWGVICTVIVTVATVFGLQKWWPPSNGTSKQNDTGHSLHALNLERRNALQNKAFAAWIERTQILKQRYSTDQLPSKSEYEDFILHFTEFAEATFTPLQIKSFQGLESGAGGEMFRHPDGLSADSQQQFIQLALIEYWLKYYTELNLKSEEPIDPEKMSV